MSDGRRRAGLAGAIFALPLVSLALVFAVGEAAVRMAGYEPIYDVYSKPSQFWQRDELLGWSLRPNASGTFVGPRPFPVEFEISIRINSQGLRGPEIPPRAEGEVRVLFLGDSVVAGFEVTEEERFTAQLERRLRERGVPARVINAGVQGYGTDQSLLYFRERGRRLAPDLAVLLHSRNDLNDNMTLHRMRRPFGKPAFALSEDGSLALVGGPIPNYPLCSAHMLDARYTPHRVDGPLETGLCGLQTRLADRSAFFTFVSMRVARLPAVVRFLKDRGMPARQRDGATRASIGVPLSALASIPAATPSSPEATEAARARLATALLRELGREIRGMGGRFLVLIKPSELARLDAGALESDGIAFRHVTLPGDPRHFRFRNDAHHNVLGHYSIGKALVPVIEEFRGTDAGRRPLEDGE